MPHGKLRLMYECNPLAFIIEQAGGRATNGEQQRILDIAPKKIHQRTPLYIGVGSMVDKAEDFLPQQLQRTEEKLLALKQKRLAIDEEIQQVTANRNRWKKEVEDTEEKET